MKKFKYKFTKLITALIYVGLALCVIGFAINLYLNISVGISSAANPVYPILQYVLMYFVTVVLFVLLLSILLSSYYAVDEKYFITSFGLIKSKYKISDVEIISLDRATNKLSVTFSDNSFIVIVVKESWYNDFIEAIIAANPKIEYNIISKENKKED
jgi:hypothetical protein